jgi:hypothetical protein
MEYVVILAVKRTHLRMGRVEFLLLRLDRLQPGRQ